MNPASRNCQYNYDFSYSLAPDAPRPTAHTPEHALAHATALLASSKLIRNRQVAQFWSALIKQNALLHLGLLLQELVEIELELNGRRSIRDTDRQYLLREEICNALKEIQAMMGREREYYTSLTVLLLAVVLLRVLCAKFEATPEPAALFHLLHWELKGQHSTSHYYEALSSDALNCDALTDFVEGEGQSFHQSINLKSLQDSNSFKRTSLVNSFAAAFNKENQSLSQNFMASFKAFKKRENGFAPVATLKTLRANSFANCLAK